MIVPKFCLLGKKVQRADSTRLEYSTNFFAVLHQIKKLNCVESGILQLSEVPIQVAGCFSRIPFQLAGCFS